MGLYPGTYPSVPSPSSGGVSVSLLPADFSSPFPCAVVPGRARVMCCAAPSFSFPCRLLRFPAPFPFSSSVSPVISVPSRHVWGAQLTHRSRHRNVTQTRAALRHSHRAVLHIDVGPHSHQASTARQAKYTGAVVCSAGAVPFSFPPFYPSSFTKRHVRLAWPSPSLTPSIVRADVADVTSEFRRVPIWPYVFPTRRFFAKNFEGLNSPLPLCIGGMRTGGGIYPLTGIIDLIMSKHIQKPGKKQLQQ